jgi:NTP pyrophosphatase (non-canonical NTP hydrolase)
MVSAEQNEILCRAINQYGRQSQIEMIIEECSELIVALQKLRRKPHDEGRVMDVHEEVADVIIMMNQAQILFDYTIIQDFMDAKIKRLSKRLSDPEFTDI